MSLHCFQNYKTCWPISTNRNVCASSHPYLKLDACWSFPLARKHPTKTNKQQQRRSVQLSITNEIQMKAVCLFLICVALLVTYASAYSQYTARQMRCLQRCQVKAHHLVVEACSKRCRQPPPISQVNPWIINQRPATAALSDNAPCIRYGGCDHRGCWTRCRKN